MRIAMVTWESLHSIAVGGVAAHVTELAAALERRGHEVHVFTRRAPGQRGHDWIHGVHYYRCTYPGHSDFVDDVNNMCRAFVDRVFEVEDFVGHFDLIHAHDWLAANAMIWIKQGRGHKGILTIHATEFARCGNTVAGGRSQRIRDQERAGTYWADRVIAVSKATEAEILSMYQVPAWKTSVVYNGVSPHLFDVEQDTGAAKRKYGLAPLDPTVLFCGRLTSQKGPDILLEAIPRVLKKHPQTKFLFAGDGDMRGALETRARQLGVVPAVRFLGLRGGGDLVSLFKLCDTVCVPSRNEPFGIVVLEAWSARKPVVVTQIGGPNEYVEHEATGLKIFPTVESVTWGLSTMFSDFDRARWMGENGRRTVEARFTWDKITEDTLAVYDPDHVPQPPKPIVLQPRAAAQTAANLSEAVATSQTAATAAAQAEPVPALTSPAAEPAVPVAAKVEQENAAGQPLRVSVKLSLKRRRNGLSVADSKAACEQVLAEAGLAAKFKGDTARIEGEWDAVLAAINHCYRVVDEIGKAQITATVELPGAIDELLAWEESEVHDEAPAAAGRSGTQSAHAVYVEGRGQGRRTTSGHQPSLGRT